MVLTNQMPGSVTLSIKAREAPGLSFKLGRTTLNRGESAVLRVRYEPVQGRPPSATAVQIVAFPTDRVITVNVSFGSSAGRRANGARRIGLPIALFPCEEHSDMVSSVNSSLAANLLGADKASPQAENTVRASDSFSQQLLSMLHSSLERLGVAAADIRPVTQGVDGPSQRQFLVTLAEERGSALAAEPPAPEVMYEDHPDFNPRLYATEEMAGWLARRLGGEVGTFQWEWSPQVAQPPRGYTIRFGDKEINAGALAIYFEPGRFVGADQEAALALFRDGVVNDYVSQHRPELIEEFGLPA